jgi:hypothetical protein
LPIGNPTVGEIAELDDGGAGQLLGPVVVDRVDRHGVAVFVGHDERAHVDPVQAVRHQLYLGERAAHAVSVDDGQPQFGGERDRDDGVDAADLRGHERGNRPLHRGLHACERPEQLRAEA